MSLPVYLYNWLFDAANPFNAANNSDALKALRTKLNASDPKTLRVFVAGNNEGGFQSASINVIWRLARTTSKAALNFGFSGTIEALYEGGDELRDALRTAFGLDGKDTGKIEGTSATLKLIAFDVSTAPKDTVDFGFTGGADSVDEKEDFDFATGLNVKYFLRLQPFGWSLPEQIQFKDAETKAIDLATVKAVGADGFHNRVFYQDPENYNKIPSAKTDNEKIVEWVTKDAQLDKYRIMPVEGFHDAPCELNTPDFAVTLLCGAVLAWQEDSGKANPDAQAAIVMNFGSLGEASVVRAVGLLEGGLTVSEDGLSKQADWDTSSSKRISESRAAYMKSLKAEDRLVTLINPTLSAFENAAGNLRKNQVLFVQMGPLQTSFFNYALFRSNLPPVIAQQSTANTAVNIGKPYFHTAGKATASDPAPRYPTTTLASPNPYSTARDMIWGGNQLGSNLDNWAIGTGRNAGPNPCQILGVDILREITAETETKDPYTSYFKSLSTFFASADEDKLSAASAYLQTQVPETPIEKNPLEDLYKKLKEQAKVGEELNLIPGILTDGKIPAFFDKLIKGIAPSFSIKVISLDPADDSETPAKITLKGDTTLFVDQGVPSALATIVFTQKDNKLIQKTTFFFGQTWSMPEVPWIEFSDLFTTFEVQDSLVPVWVELGGEYTPVETSLKTRIPSEKDQWLVEAAFGNRPSIDKVFQMAAGVNLVESLPAPYNTLVDLGLSKVEVAYGLEAEKIDALSFAIKSNSPDPLPLVGKISLGDLEIQSLIIDPLNDQSAKVDASGVFTIGDGAEAGKVKVVVSYPDFLFTGKLTEGVITFESMLDTFLPGVALDLPELPKIDQFDFSYRSETDAMAVSMNLNIDWSFGFPFSGEGSKDLFTLKSVGFSVNCRKKKNTGSVIAHTELFPESSAKVGVDVSAEYMADSNWKFIAATTNNVDAKVIISDYLGPEWVPEFVNLPVMKDISVSMVWGKGTGAESKAQSFEFKAKTAEPWAPIPALENIFTLDFDLTLGYGPMKSDSKALVAPAAKSAVVHRSTLPKLMSSTAPVVGSYGKLLADIELWNIHLRTTYEFQQDGTEKFCVTWTDVGLTACIDNDNAKKQYIATFSLEDQSVGSIVEKFVSWATGTSFGLQAPWNILDDIDLSGLEIIYNFSEETVGFKIDVGPIDLGLFSVNAITLDYNPKGNPTAWDANGNVTARAKDKVEISIDGSFVWQDSDSLKWAPDDPNSTPSAPGSGSKYFDLRLLALGQHVEVKGLTKLRTVKEVIEKLEGLNIPQPPDVPLGGDNQPTFNAKSSWFVAFDFGILKVEKEEKKGEEAAAADDKEEDAATYFISLGIVFNDPNLYALQLSLDGPMAKIFAGLNFQIMYQQYSKNVGRYSAEIALPMVMRKFQIGAASVTLPTFAIDIFTNGDFQIDIGFPWKEDFSRSFSIEFMAGPIPVLGSAGFYFGKLSSASTDKVPTTSRGWFNPVIVFGFGAQIGLGKSIEAGILSAGFSLTAFGIIEGVIARWLPYQEPTTDGNSNELQDGYYFSLTGTVGVQGRLYGSINFAIISAELNVAIKLFVRITFASYEPIPITAKASVDVSLAVKINLGLFKVTIHLSFKAEVETTFVLDNPMGSKAPWADDSLMAASADSISAVSAQKRLAARGLNKIAPMSRDGLFAMSAQSDSFSPIWGNLGGDPALQLLGYVAPALTVAAGDVDDSPAKQPICYAINFFLEGEKPVQATDPDALTAQSAQASSAQTVASNLVAHAARERVRGLTAMSAGGDKFESLAERVLQWIIAAGQPAPAEPDEHIPLAEVGALIVSDAFLSNAVDYLADTANPIPADAIASFLSSQAHMEFKLKQDAGDADTPVVYFPAAPGIQLKVPKNENIAGSTGYDYKFGAYNKSTDGYVEQLNSYFNELKVQIEAEDTNVLAAAAAPAAELTGPSISEYIFGDYFAMIGRLTLQALRDGLRNFKLDIQDHAGQTAKEIIDAINEKSGLVGEQQYTLSELFVANQKHTLNVVSLKISGMTWQSPGGKSFDAIASDLAIGGDISGNSIALLNGQSPNILAAGVVVSSSDLQYTTQTADSLETVALALGFTKKVGDIHEGDVAALLAAVPEITSSPEMLAAQAILNIPTFSNTTDGETPLQDIAQKFAVTIDQLAAMNGDVVGLFSDTANPSLNVPHLSQYTVSDLIDETKRTLGLQHISAQVSRYYLHGLRLPTAFENSDQKLVAEAKGLFAEPGADYPKNLGLFALSGQMIPLPDIADPTTAGPDAIYAFSLTAGGEDWLTLDGSKSIEYKLTAEHDNTNWLQFDAVRRIAHGNYLDTGVQKVLPMPMASAEPSRYPLSTEIPWQPAVAINLPRESAVPTTPRPRMWSLPNELINTPHNEGILPTVKPVLARTDEARGTTVDEAVNNYGFGSLISFKVKRVYATDASGLAKRTYEIMGAPESEITLLERLLDRVRDSDETFNQVNLFYRPSTTGSDVSGWQSDDAAQSLMGITQTNLSTETRPAGSNTLSAQDASANLTNIIGLANGFIRLLWEASITRQGGYYLNYSTGINGGDVKGLPDHVFNDRGEAELAILCIFEPGSAVGQSLGNYMNVAVTNEPYDLDDAAFVAVAVPVEVDGRDFVPGIDTLNSYAADYYMGVGLLVEQNATVALKDGAVVAIEGGLYQVPAADGDDGPGGDLNAIAAYFFTTVKEIKAVNSETPGLPDTLSKMTAIKLPPIKVTIGGNAPANDFAGLSKYFNAPLAELAAANAETLDENPLFDAVKLNATTGPVSLAPDIKQGVAGVTLERPIAVVPEKVQSDPDTWGLEYLRQNFSLLGYRIAGNAENHYFSESNWGLPSGPINPDAETSSEKVQAPKEIAPDDKWNFALSVPYAKVLDAEANSGDANLYAGVGDILQFELNWLDIYGNRVLSQLQDPKPTPSMPHNKVPQITGYVDRILGLGQWPAVVNAYSFYKDSSTGVPMLQLQANFDAPTYVTAAENIKSGDPKRVEAGQRVIAQAKSVYALLMQQLNDPIGVNIELSTSMVPNKIWSMPENDQGAQMSLSAWAKSIVDFLDSLPDRPTSPDTPSAPPAEYSFVAALGEEALNGDQIFKLSVEVGIKRKAGLVSGDLRTAKGVGKVSTRIAPTTGPLTDDDTAGQRGLEKLAGNFAEAFASTPDRGYRLATGADRNVFTGTGNSPVWVIEIGKQGSNNPISYDILDKDDPAIFAPRPISNTLKSKEKTSIIRYKTGEVISETGTSVERSFVSIDLDKWMRTTLTSIDGLLAPKYVTAADVLRKQLATATGNDALPDALKKVLDAKKNLAGALRGAMVAVYKDEDPKDDQLEDIQEAFRQAMLGSVGTFYTVKAGIQFTADVHAAIEPQKRAIDVPRIFGDIGIDDTVGTVVEHDSKPVDGNAKAQKNISVSSPKLDLEFNENGPSDAKSSPYLSSLLSSTTSDAKSVKLNLTFDGQYIEHEIGRLNGIKDYKPSSWLSLVQLSDNSDSQPFTAELGEFEVPIVLRAFPDMPALISQDGITDFTSTCLLPPAEDMREVGRLVNMTSCAMPGDTDPLQAVTQWAYAFEYTMQVHEPQDIVHGTISFNIADPNALFANAVPERDLFDNLAEFVHVYPDILKDLNAYLLPIDVTSTDEQTLMNAQNALLSAATLIDWVAQTAEKTFKPVVVDSDQDDAITASSAIVAEPVGFALSEGPALHSGVEVLQVELKLNAPLPERVGAPLVEIPGFECERQPIDPTKPLVSSFRYKQSTAPTPTYLSAADGRVTPPRKVVLPNLDILERQDAQTEVYITRNADIIEGKTIEDAFVYQTPRISFDGPLHPTLQRDDPINIATIYSDKLQEPVQRTLVCQLSGLYDVLFANAATPDVTMQMSLYYEYEVNKNVSLVRLPVYLMPPMGVALTGIDPANPAQAFVRNGATVTPLEEVIARQAQGWETWFNANQPSTLGGQLRFELTVMSNLTEQPMPTLKLTGLYLPIADIV